MVYKCITRVSVSYKRNYIETSFSTYDFGRNPSVWSLIFYYLKRMEITYSTLINGTFHKWSLSSDVQRDLKCIVSWERKPHKCTSDGSYFLHNKEGEIRIYIIIS